MGGFSGRIPASPTILVSEDFLSSRCNHHQLQIEFGLSKLCGSCVTINSDEQKRKRGSSFVGFSVPKEGGTGQKGDSCSSRCADSSFTWEVGEVGLHPLVSFGSFIDYSDHTYALQCLGGYGDLQSEEIGEGERNQNRRGFASSKGDIRTVVCCFCEAGAWWVRRIVTLLGERVTEHHRVR